MSLFFLGVIAGVFGTIIFCLMLPDAEDDENEPIEEEEEDDDPSIGEEWELNQEYDHEEGNM